MAPLKQQRDWYRSLDELADTPEFRALVEREFPGQSAELDASPLARRTFLQLMAASLGLAGMAGCRRPELEILPYNKQPEPVVAGLPTFYATSLPRPGGALPVLVECHQGRPTKIEGNPLYEPTGGATDATAQAAILDLYDPDRARQVIHQGEPSTWEAFDDFTRDKIGKLIAAGGAGLRVLVPVTISPATALVLEDLLTRAPDTQVHRWEPAFGPRRRLLIEQADVIVAIHSDFLGGGADSPSNLKAFAARKKAAGNDGRPPLRLYAIEPVYTVTGGAADHRLPLSARQCESFAAALALAVNPQAPAAEHLAAIVAAGELPPVAEVWVQEIAADLRQAGRRSLVVSEGELATYVTESLKSYGVTHDIYTGHDEAHDSLLVERGQGTLHGLTAELTTGAVDTLVIVGGNPAYDAPGALNFAAALQKVKHTIRLGLYDDETAALCEWRVPLAHSLESWDDAQTPEGYYAVAQPVIAPLFGGRSLIEALARLSGHKTPTAYELVRLSYQRQSYGRSNAGVDAGFKQALHDGFLRNSRPETVEIEAASESPQAAALTLAYFESRAKRRVAEKTTSKNIELLCTWQPRLANGALANNGWLQELADPVTKLVWTNALLVSPQLAQELAIATGDMVRITVGDKSLTAPAWIQPGQAARTVSIDLGYGRTRAGHVGNGVGVDAYPLLGWSPEIQAEQTEFQNVKLEKTGEHVELACTQNHWSMEGRDLIREDELGAATKHAEPTHAAPEKGHSEQGHAEHGHADQQEDHAGHAGHGKLNIVEPPALDGKHQWGMVIDLNACIGCGACELACQAENNIPIVGADEVRRGRLMHWLRLDRYFNGPIEDPRMAHQPVACVHCENAPCEIVCPVNATVHSPEGLNLQVYNRCIGTRYCSNNCPYKARRFNWFDYHGRALGELRLGPLADYNVPETQKMLMNPDVTVRMRGVMEKCNYCIQRIERGKLGAKLASDGPTYTLADGAVTPACAQSCAAQAIVFGDLSDKSSRVSKLKQDARHYDLLGELNTRPRTSYLSRVRNVNHKLEERLAALGSPATH